MNDSKELTTSVILRDQTVCTELRDPRAETFILFDELGEAERVRLAADAWVIGLRALGNAYSQARESRLADVGRALLDDMERQLRAQMETQQAALNAALKRFFDPTDGQVSQRLAAFVADHGELDRFLRGYLGAEQSVLAETLARKVGEDSELFKRLDPHEKQGVVGILETSRSACSKTCACACAT